MKPLRILCDVDGVLADFVGLVLDYAARTYGLTACRREAVDQWDCFAALGMPTEWPRFHAACDTLELCRGMAELPGARAFYAELRRIGTVRVCTSPMNPRWLTQRAEWLVSFGVPLNEQIHWHDKHELARSSRQASGYDVLIDDKAENCEAFVRAGGKAYCIATPYNVHLAAHVPRGTHAECLAWLRTEAGV